MATIDIWVYREQGLGYDPVNGRDLTGYGVEALDGSIGKIDKASNDVGAELHHRRHRAVDLRQEGHAAGRCDRAIDEQERKVWVGRTKDQIKDAPEFDESMLSDSGYRDELGTYYGPGGRGYRDANESIS